MVCSNWLAVCSGDFSNYQVAWLSTYIKERAVLNVMARTWTWSIEAVVAIEVNSGLEACPALMPCAAVYHAEDVP